mmetsp:Transcript_10100/g.28385  ORF Transcript_10100/g.28385 Transcript_10100/m.28385 type:complete len:358 (-) Transcript_10100:129-1202(-)
MHSHSLPSLLGRCQCPRWLCWMHSENGGGGDRVSTLSQNSNFTWCRLFHLWKYLGARSWKMWSLISSFDTSLPHGPAATEAYSQYQSSLLPVGVAYRLHCCRMLSSTRAPARSFLNWFTLRLCRMTSTFFLGYTRPSSPMTWLSCSGLIWGGLARAWPYMPTLAPSTMMSKGPLFFSHFWNRPKWLSPSLFMRPASRSKASWEMPSANVSKCSASRSTTRSFSPQAWHRPFSSTSPRASFHPAGPWGGARGGSCPSRANMSRTRRRENSLRAGSSSSRRRSVLRELSAHRPWVQASSRYACSASEKCMSCDITSSLTSHMPARSLLAQKAISDGVYVLSLGCESFFPSPNFLAASRA